MRLLSATSIGLLLAALAVGKEPSRPPSPSGPALTPLFSRQTVFSIPYRIDPPAPGARLPVEVQLHVSENRGPWRLYSKVPPTQTSFTYRAAGDGDYWFMVRTRDDQGNVQPPTPPAPEMWVIVDTEPPVLELAVERGPGGELRARWRATDNYLRAEKMKLEYQVAGSVAWQPVAIDPPRDAVRKPVYAGEAAWVAGSGGEAVIVRAEIADAAGNLVKTQQQAAPVRDHWRQRTADRRDGRSPDSSFDQPPDRSMDRPWDRPLDRQPILGPEPPWRDRMPERDGDIGGRGSRATRWQPEASDEPLTGGAASDMGDRFPGRGVQRSALARPVNDRPAADPRLARQPIAEEVLPPPVESTRSLAGREDERRDPLPRRPQPDEATFPEGPANATRRGQLTRRELSAGEGGPWLGAADAPARPIAQQTIEPGDRGGSAATESRGSVVEERIDGPPPSGNAGPIGGAVLPQGARPRMVNTSRFELEYEIESVGPSGIAKVELWGTRDGGRSWTSYGIDPDNRSPMAVTVGGEGLYGFCIVIESGTGLRGAPPESGDPPEIWVGVDTVKPAARLTTADLGGGERSGELTIHWEASDSLLAARPIALSYSPTPGGPWTTIAAGLENTGSYTWRLDNRVPDRVYLRLEARDEAGNVQTFEAADPVSLDPVRPKGRIRNVRPVGEASSARGPQWYYNLR